MQEFTNWTVDTIRSDKLLGAWLEERKFDWLPLVSQTITNIIDKSKSVLIITDDEHEWFMKYILTNINKKKLASPYFPFYAFDSFYSNIYIIKN